MTSSPALVRAAWDANVWQTDAVGAMTPNVFDYDVLDLLRDNTLNSQAVVDMLVGPPQVMNFITCLVSREEQMQMEQQRLLTYHVQVTRYLSVDIDGTNFKRCIDDMVAIDDLVIANLGPRWSDTVNYYQTQKGPIPVKKETVAEGLVWYSRYTYLGVEMA